ncbi:hypothetical protein JT358_03130 [Micrococcales bacterium 31B]|nr:hypothetical protein [Micrococcales bacterium 31B]
MTTQFTRRTLWGASLAVAAACAAPWVTTTAAEAKGTRELAPTRDAEATTPSPTYPITVYSVAYSPNLFMAVDGGGVRYINWEEWQHRGFPTPQTRAHPLRAPALASHCVRLTPVEPRTVHVVVARPDQPRTRGSR